MSDPYCWPGSDCLRNKLGIRDLERLRISEARIVSARDVLLAKSTLPGEYNLEHFKAFHRELFQDVYDWADETRTVDLSLGDSTFGHWRYIDEDVSSVLHRLSAAEGLLAGRKRASFVEGLAYFYGEINSRHAFREGNGRTQRAFLRQVSAAAGWRVDWSGLDRARNEHASRESLLSAGIDSLVKVLDPIVSQI